MDQSTWTAVAAVATAVAAAGSCIAAGVTAWMANETRRMARATVTETDQAKQQVELARMALQAETRPWIRPADFAEVVDFPDKIDPLYGDPATAGEIWVRLSLENVGRGLAVFPPHAFSVVPSGRPAGVAINPVSATKKPVLAPDEECEVFFRVRKSTTLAEFRSLEVASGRRSRDILGELFVDVRYTDVAGGQETVMAVQLARDENDVWHIGRVEYRSDDRFGGQPLTAYMRPY